MGGSGRAIARRARDRCAGAAASGARESAAACAVGRTGARRADGRARPGRAAGRRAPTELPAARRVRSRLLGAKARLRLRPVRRWCRRWSRRRRRAAARRRRRGTCGGSAGYDEPEALGLLDDSLRRRRAVDAVEPALLVGALLLGDLRVEVVELQLALREDDVEHDRAHQREHGDERDERRVAPDVAGLGGDARRRARRAARRRRARRGARRRAARVRAPAVSAEWARRPWSRLEPLDRTQAGAARRAGSPSTSASDGRSGAPGEQPGERVALRARAGPSARSPGSSVRDQSAKRSFTMRSSSEWYASTSMRPSGSRRCTDSSSPAGEVRQLAVDLHADGLERATRRVTTAAAGRRGDAALDRLDEVTGRLRAGGRRRSRPRCGARSAPRRCGR